MELVHCERLSLVVPILLFFFFQKKKSQFFLQEMVNEKTVINFPLVVCPWLCVWLAVKNTQCLALSLDQFKSHIGIGRRVGSPELSADSSYNPRVPSVPTKNCGTSNIFSNYFCSHFWHFLRIFRENMTIIYHSKFNLIFGSTYSVKSNTQ